MPVCAALLFDFHDTLATYHEPPGALEARVLAELGFEFRPEMLSEALAEANAYWSSSEPVDHSAYSSSRERYNVFQRTIHEGWLRRLGLNPDHPELFERLSHAWDDPGRLRPFPDTVPALRRLQSAGYRLGVVSNWSWGLHEILSEHALAPFFECTIVSARVGYRKPHPAIYAAALDALDLPPERVIFIGDSPHADVYGPRGAGMTPVHLDRRDAHAPIPDVARIKDLHELVDLVGA